MGLWASNDQRPRKERFDWNTTARLLRVPVIRKLFHESGRSWEARGAKFGRGTRLDRRGSKSCRPESFFSKFQESAVQYFYEPFLEEFDPELRKELGVWYTPHEIVEYMVERVDTVLREEFGLPDGLADNNVYVLDPCCGTGSYLVEVLRRIHKTLKKRGEDAFLASDLKEAAQARFRFRTPPGSFRGCPSSAWSASAKFRRAPHRKRRGTRRGLPTPTRNVSTGWESADQPPLVLA